ncbi:MAG: L-2-hydroxyglutarate oxidase [Ignavibacteria bacterium]
MKNFDVLITGAGILGLCSAYMFIKNSPDTKICILEKENYFAKHQSGHNSGVIHSGIYYKPDSLKAKNCIRGYEQLLHFCKEFNVPFEICGKLIIATSEKEISVMNELKQRGIENGLKNLKEISENQIKEIEPYAAGIKALHVPQTGIVDYRIVCEKIYNHLKNKNVSIVFDEEVKKIKRINDGVEIYSDKESYSAKCLVNCAGLYSDKLAKMSGMKINFSIIPFRGEYYRLREESKKFVKNLIYPVPDPEFPFLGVHFTRRADGVIEAGPNAVLAFGRESYKKSDFNFKESIDTLKYKGFREIAARYWKTGFYEYYRSFSKREFVRSLQKLIPDIKGDDLIAGGSGIRAQACTDDGKLIDDFLILEDENIINVCNAPSPAATSSFSIGETIADKIIAKLN